MRVNKNTILWLMIIGLTVSVCYFTFLPVKSIDRNKQIPVPYPVGYRQWIHVKTAVVEPGNPSFEHFGGFHHIYANKEAMKGYKTRHFPDGSIIVFDVLEAIDTNKLLLEGRRRQLDVMVRDTGNYAATGGWGFEEFSGDSKVKRRVRTSAKTTCYSCHASQTTFVFSELRP